MGDWLFGWFYELMYTLQKSICYLLDFIREIFCKLAGIETVTISGNEEDLLTHFIVSDEVKNAFLGVFLIGVILLFVFVIIAIVKSETADLQHKKTKGQIIAKSLQSFVTFLLIPFLLIAGIILVNTIMVSLNGAMSGAFIDGNANVRIGGQILVTSGYDAYIGDGASRAEIEHKFITGALDYNSLSVVKQYYNIADMNFFVGIAGGLLILIMFVMSSVTFVQRIFDIILLYIISPVSVSTIPLDDGARFRLWREMLISKVLGAYGIILCTNLFFLIVPQISQISFFGNSFKNGIVQLIFIIGGSFAVTKANMVISQLTGSNAGSQETQQMLSNIYYGARMIRSVGHAATGTVGAVLGGADFLRNRKHGASFSENLTSAIHSQRNRKTKGEGNNNDDDPKGGGAQIPGNDIDKSIKKNASHDNPSGDKGMDSFEETHGEKPIVQTTVLDNFKENQDTQNSENETAYKPLYTESESENNEKGKARNAFKAVGRLSTLPAGVLKDLIQGGVITAGKNLFPRMRNVVEGHSLVNHAEVLKSDRELKTSEDKNIITLKAKEKTINETDTKEHKS